MREGRFPNYGNTTIELRAYGFPTEPVRNETNELNYDIGWNVTGDDKKHIFSAQPGKVIDGGGGNKHLRDCGVTQQTLCHESLANKHYCS
jgi:hypothetical protein